MNYSHFFPIVKMLNGFFFFVVVVAVTEFKMFKGLPFFLPQ